MRKLQQEFENPIDHVIIDVADQAVPELYHKFGMTPNIITTIGNIIRAISIYLLLAGNNIGFFFTAFVGYVFDCLDGHCARMFGLCSKFGDYYDHVSDVSYHLLLVYLLFTSSTLTGLSTMVKMGIALFIVILHGLSALHLGCQEKIHSLREESVESPTLGPLKYLCPNPEMIRWTKYFGCGTSVTISYLLIAYFFRV